LSSLHSDEMEGVPALLVIAPVGIYLERVRTGIDIVLGSQTKVGVTKVQVVLTAEESWLKADESYKAEFIDYLKDKILETWKKGEGLDIACDCVALPMEDEEFLTGWLLKELYLYFKNFPNEAEAFIDLTSAPKEWQFAAINALNFFPKVELYYVKSAGRKQPRQYDEAERKDPGHPRLEVVRTGAVRQPLPRWIQPRNEKGEPNVQYRLFETIFALAESIAADKGLDPSSELDKVWVPIEEEQGLVEYKRHLPEKLKSKYLDNSALKKSISKCLTDVQFFGLFEVKGSSVRMTLRAAVLGQVLFANRRKQEKREEERK